ncbi:MAG: hypothetical protein F4039_09025 [Gammaproteobacteria bacterium]|nr:hypothetical protein [Gammaproteobacteria bacterium]
MCSTCTRSILEVNLMKLLNSKATAQRLVQLIDSHDNISFAVAWAKISRYSKSNAVIHAMKASKDKIRKSVIGTDFQSTDWRVLDWFSENKAEVQVMKVKKAKINSVFHPKIYLFWTDGRWDLLIGSANLTGGGMKTNTELVLHVSSDDCENDKLFRRAEKEINEYWIESDPITGSWLYWYKKENLKSENEKSHPNSTSPPADTQVPNILHMKWPEFLLLIQLKDPSGYALKARLDLLSMARKIFQRYESYGQKSFYKMKDSERKALAGTIRVGRDEFEGVDIGSFGYTDRGEFPGLIKNNSKNVSRALSCIPLEGEVEKRNYMDYIQEIVQGSVATLMG